MIVPIEQIEAAIREVMDQLCSSNSWAAPINAYIPRRMYGLAVIAVDYYTGAELKIVGNPNPGTKEVFVHADGYREDQAHVNQVVFDAARILAKAA